MQTMTARKHIAVRDRLPVEQWTMESMTHVAESGIGAFSWVDYHAETHGWRYVHEGDCLLPQGYDEVALPDGTLGWATYCHEGCPAIPGDCRYFVPFTHQRGDEVIAFHRSWLRPLAVASEVN